MGNKKRNNNNNRNIHKNVVNSNNTPKNNFQNNKKQNLNYKKNVENYQDRKANNNYQNNGKKQNNYHQKSNNKNNYQAKFNNSKYQKYQKNQNHINQTNVKNSEISEKKVNKKEINSNVITKEPEKREIVKEEIVKVEPKVLESKKSSTVEKENVVNVQKENIVEKEDGKEKEKKSNHILLIIVLIVLLFIIIVVGCFLFNFLGDKIISNIYIQDVNVSHLSKEDAKNKVMEKYSNLIGKDMKYSFNDKDYTINLDEIEFSLRLDEAINYAMHIGRNENIFVAGKDFYKQQLGNVQNIEIDFDYNKDKLYSKITEIEKDFVKEVKQFSYNTDNDILTVYRGTPGVKVDYQKIEEQLGEAVDRKDLEKVVQIPISLEEPEDIDVTKIHNEIFVDMKNAYYTINPFEIHPEVRGVNFDIKALNEMIAAEPDKGEYSIPLLITEPTVRVENLELYTDELGICSTSYVNNPNRTQNLRLAASKVNEYILMPGETFSYNETVGERTIAAGYRSAAIYVNGEVEDGVGGGICQISSTIYNAVVEADLEIVERYNHARVPSYLSAGKDATVYWGSKDFKFRNNRSYPVKIEVSVGGGYATARILGTKTENEYEISIETSVISRYNGYLVVNAYKVYRQDGEEVKRELLSTDSYKIG